MPGLQDRSNRDAPLNVPGVTLPTPPACRRSTVLFHLSCCGSAVEGRHPKAGEAWRVPHNRYPRLPREERHLSVRGIPVRAPRISGRTLRPVFKVGPCHNAPSPRRFSIIWLAGSRHVRRLDCIELIWRASRVGSWCSVMRYANDTLTISTQTDKISAQSESSGECQFHCQDMPQAEPVLQQLPRMPRAQPLPLSAHRPRPELPYPPEGMKQATSSHVRDRKPVRQDSPPSPRHWRSTPREGNQFVYWGNRFFECPMYQAAVCVGWAQLAAARKNRGLFTISRVGERLSARGCNKRVRPPFPEQNIVVLMVPGNSMSESASCLILISRVRSMR